MLVLENNIRPRGFIHSNPERVWQPGLQVSQFAGRLLSTIWSNEMAYVKLKNFINELFDSFCFVIRKR